VSHSNEGLEICCGRRPRHALTLYFQVLANQCRRRAYVLRTKYNIKTDISK
jgi:hypothetical protein